MAKEERTICDICGQVISENDAKARQFKVKENTWHGAWMYNGTFHEFKKYRGWEIIDCHDECIMKLFGLKKSNNPSDRILEQPKPPIPKGNVNRGD